MNCGIPTIDRLMVDASAPPVDTSDRSAVAALQGLLIGHGFRRLPTLLDRACGTYGPVTNAALNAFRSAHSLPACDGIDAPTLRALVTTPAENPVLSRPYTALVLDVEFTGVLPMAAVTMQLEGGGAFAAANWNTDRCGLSFGLIQWAQKPGRLHELLAALNTTAPDLFVGTFTSGDPALARDLLAHTARPFGGVDPRTGETIDARFDLVAEPWRTRFRAAGREPIFQRQQIVTAVAAFERSLLGIRQTMPAATSERGLTMMLDVANQFGDAGAKSVAVAVARPGMSEADFLLAVERETVARVSRQYGASSAEASSTANRRELVRTTPWLTDGPASIAVSA
jgi:peptidoglycan hydrolase-like protein with peptidoglycan-binding domain